MQSPDLPPLADVVLRLADVFERLGVPYAIGGAVATSFWGVPRTTTVHPGRATAALDPEAGR